MHLTVVCQNGTRRSAALAAYIEYHRKENLIDGLTVKKAAITDKNQLREQSKQSGRLRACETACFANYSLEVRQLRQARADVHPRIGIILLQEGITPVLEQRVQILTPEIIDDSDLVLTATGDMKITAQGLTPHQERVQTIREYCGRAQGGLDVPDVRRYMTLFTKGRVKRDRKLCIELREYALDIINKL